MDVLISNPSCHRHARTEGLRTIHFNNTACVASRNFVARLKANLWFWNILDIVYYGKYNSTYTYMYTCTCVIQYNGVYISLLSSNAFKWPGGTNTSPRRYMPVANCQPGPIGLANIPKNMWQCGTSNPGQKWGNHRWYYLKYNGNMYELVLSKHDTSGNLII